MSNYSPCQEEEEGGLGHFYGRRLLFRGWAGRLTLEEAEYIRDRLEADGKLKRRWLVRRRQVPLLMVAEKAFPEDREAARRHLAAEMAKARRRKHLLAEMSLAANLDAEATTVSREEHGPAGIVSSSSNAGGDKSADNAQKERVGGHEGG